MLRSSPPAGASLADAETNANAAVLAHSVLFIPNLDATHPALENRHRRAPARGLSTGGTALRISWNWGANAPGAHSLRFFSHSSNDLRAVVPSPAVAPSH